MVRGWAISRLGLSPAEFYLMRPGEFWEAIRVWQADKEADRRHVETLRRNIAEIAESASGRCDVSVADAYRWISTYSGPGFSIVFADPPYALGKENGYADFLKTLAMRGVTRPGGLFIAEMTASQDADEPPGWRLLRDRRYGKTRICIWRREGDNK